MLSAQPYPYAPSCLSPPASCRPLHTTPMLPPSPRRYNVNKFLNRLLGLPVQAQNALFEFYSSVFKWVVFTAKVNPASAVHVNDVKAGTRHSGDARNFKRRHTPRIPPFNTFHVQSVDRIASSPHPHYSLHKTLFHHTPLHRSIVLKSSLLTGQRQAGAVDRVHLGGERRVRRGAGCVAAVAF